MTDIGPADIDAEQRAAAPRRGQPSTTRQVAEVYRLAQIRDRNGIGTVSTEAIGARVGLTQNHVAELLREPWAGVGFLPNWRRDRRGAVRPTRITRRPKRTEE